MRLAILASHPIQYQAPLFRELGRRLDLTVLFAHRAGPSDQACAGFGVAFDWDIDLLSGYRNRTLDNVSRKPGLDDFFGCDTPSVSMELTRGKFDALLVMGWYLKCFWQAVWAAKRSGIPVMVRGDSHLLTARGRLKRLVKLAIYPPGLRVFDIALYVGVLSRRYWEYYFYPKNRLISSPHCVDNLMFAQRATTDARRSLRERYGIGPADKVVLFAGKLVPAKRPLDLVAAAALLNASGHSVTVLVAGAGSLEGEVVRAANTGGVRLVPLGFCNQSMMPSVYSASDLLVLPSEGETWGLVANEALACGRPIVVSDACGCAPDLTDDGTAGRTFRAGNVPELAATIWAVLTSPPTAALVAKKAAEYSVDAAAAGVCRGLGVIEGRSPIFR